MAAATALAVTTEEGRVPQEVSAAAVAAEARVVAVAARVISGVAAVETALPVGRRQ